MASSKIIKFKNVEIVYTDVSNSSVEEAIAVMDVNHNIITKKPHKSVLSLVNIRGVAVNGLLLAKLRANINRNNPYVLATAVVGLNSFKRVLLDTLIAFTGRKIIALETIEEAKLWLHDQYEKNAIEVPQ